LLGIVFFDANVIGINQSFDSISIKSGGIQFYKSKPVHVYKKRNPSNDDFEIKRISICKRSDKNDFDNLLLSFFGIFGINFVGGIAFHFVFLIMALFVFRHLCLRGHNKETLEYFAKLNVEELKKKFPLDKNNKII